jgi:hypothetical protein
MVAVVGARRVEAPVTTSATSSGPCSTSSTRGIPPRLGGAAPILDRPDGSSSIRSQGGPFERRADRPERRAPRRAQDAAIKTSGQALHVLVPSGDDRPRRRARSRRGARPVLETELPEIATIARPLTTAALRISTTCSDAASSSRRRSRTTTPGARSRCRSIGRRSTASIPSFTIRPPSPSSSAAAIARRRARRAIVASS